MEVDKVEVVDYNEEWPRKYVYEANVIRNILVSELITITHIGSTAVPGLKAKPTIDILAFVKDVKKLDDLNEKFEAAGYRCLGEDGIKGRRFFMKSDNSVHVHAYDDNNRDRIEALLAFYDYLKDNPEVAKEYEDLKVKLAKKYPRNIKKYTQGKAAFTKEIETKAVNQYRHKDIEQI